MVWVDHTPATATRPTGSCSVAAPRKFYSYNNRADDEGSSQQGERAPTNSSDSHKLVEYVSNNVIGSETVFTSPFGPRKVVYCDYTASGRSLCFLEDYIASEVLPHYGSTHTTATNTALQTTMFRHEARDVIRSAVRASDSDRVLLTGSGATGAVVRLLHGLALTQPPVVMVGPFLHHSALLPWREAGAKVIRIRESADGSVDLTHLEHVLQQQQQQQQQHKNTQAARLIGCFSAASNVTGVLTDTVAVTVLLHRYSALAFWDYATAAPYVQLDMNPVALGPDAGLAYIDAMFFSLHKFIGGPQTPGVLVAKRTLFHPSVPAVPGGGSIFFVSRARHRYLQDEETREEGGTPAIVGDIRAGLVVMLKEAITPDWIMGRHQQLAGRLSEMVSSTPNLVSLGPAFGSTTTPRLPILSFLVRHPSTGLYLHHNYVAALLNDVFGVQARGGCACAGPYALDLLGIHEELADKYHEALVEPCGLNRHDLRRRQEHSDSEVLRPGFVRLNLPYTASDAQVEFILSAVQRVCSSGWRLLPQYSLNPETGEWRHRTQQVMKGRQWLGNVSYSGGQFSLRSPPPSRGAAPDYAACLQLADKLLLHADKAARQYPDVAADQLLLTAETRPLRWFVLPSEARQQLLPGSAVPGGRCHCPGVVLPAGQHEELGHDAAIGSDTRSVDAGFACSGNQKDVSSVRRDGQCSDCNQALPPSHSAPDGRAPFTPPRYPLSKELLEDRSDYTWHERPRLHYWPAAGSQHAGDERQRGEEIANSSGFGVIEDTMLKSHSVSNGNVVENSSLFNTKDIVIDSSDAGIEDMSSLSLNELEHNSKAKINNEPKAVHEKMSLEHPHLPASDEPLLSISKDLSVRDQPIKEINSHKNISRNQISKSLLPRSKESNITSNSSNAVTNILAPRPKDNVADASILSPKEDAIASDDIANSLSPRPKADDTTSAAATCSDMTCFLPRPQSEAQVAPQPRAKWHVPPKDLFTPMVEAMKRFSMIRDGDKVLVCLSGGKDSLSLLHLLHQYQYYARSRGVCYTLGAVTVDPESASYDPRPLIPYLASLGVHYLYEQQGILQQALSLPDLNSICSFCSRMKRGRIYAAARRSGYNVLAFGQHLDDLTESFLMSVMHNGRLRTMKACYTVQQGDLRVIRPLVFVREKQLRHFAESRALPVIPENCPACFEVPKERHRSKQLLAQQELLFPQVFWSLRTALLPLMSINATGLENAVLGKGGLLSNGSMAGTTKAEEDDEEDL